MVCTPCGSPRTRAGRPPSHASTIGVSGAEGHAHTARHRPSTSTTSASPSSQRHPQAIGPRGVTAHPTVLGFARRSLVLVAHVGVQVVARRRHPTARIRRVGARLDVPSAAQHHVPDHALPHGGPRHPVGWQLLREGRDRALDESQQGLAEHRRARPAAPHPQPLPAWNDLRTHHRRRPQLHAVSSSVVFETNPNIF